MSYLDRYEGKRRVIRKALNLHDKLNKIKNDMLNTEHQIQACEAKMTGGDLGAYQRVLNSDVTT